MGLKVSLWEGHCPTEIHADLRRSGAPCQAGSGSQRTARGLAIGDFLARTRVHLRLSALTLPLQAC